MRSVIGSIKKRKGDDTPKKECPLSVTSGSPLAMGAGPTTDPADGDKESTVNENAPIVRDFAESPHLQDHQVPDPGPKGGEPIAENLYAATRPPLSSFKDPDAFILECRRRAREVSVRVAALIAAGPSPDGKISTASDKEADEQAEKAEKRGSGGSLVEK